jgi:hypothetical protein
MSSTHYNAARAAYYPTYREGAQAEFGEQFRPLHLRDHAAILGQVAGDAKWSDGISAKHTTVEHRACPAGGDPSGCCLPEALDFAINDPWQFGHGAPNAHRNVLDDIVGNKSVHRLPFL